MRAVGGGDGGEFGAAGAGGGEDWSGLLWLTFLTGVSLLVPRIAWHMGIGRYVDTRDGQLSRKV